MPLEIKEILPRLLLKTFALANYFYVPWYTYYTDMAFGWIVNIFQIYFKMSSQRKRGGMNIFMLLYDSWKF